jgi:DNA-binding transcriptional ArsR family regulator
MQYFNNCCNIKTMDKITATTIFESLSSGVRLDVFRLLVKTGLDGMVAGEIAAALDIPNTNLSFHLKAMTHAGLVTVQQEGRFQRYRANFPLMLETIAYLTEECCSGNPDQCATIRGESSCSPNVMPKINQSIEEN